MANIISEPIMRLYRYVAGKWAKSAEVNEEMDMFVESHNNVVTDLNALKNQQDIDRSDLQNQITTNKNDSESRDANLQSQITTNKNDSEARDTNLQNQINSLSSTKADKAEIYTKEEINSENGANNIGNKPLVLGGTNKLQPTLEWLKSQIDKTALGQIPDGSLTEIKMANEMKKDIEGGVASYDSLRNLYSQMAELATKEELNEHKADNMPHGLNAPIQAFNYVNFRNELTEQQISEIESNPVLMQIIKNSTGDGKPVDEDGHKYSPRKLKHVLEDAEVQNTSIPSTPKGIVGDDNYIYLIGMGYLYKLNKTNLAIVSSIGSNNGNSIAIDDEYIYIGYSKIFKYKKSTLELVGETSLLSSSSPVTALAIDENFIYVIFDGTVHKFRKDNLTSVATSQIYSGYGSLGIDDDYVYIAGNSSTNKLTKLRKSDLTQVAQSANFAVYQLAVNKNYIMARSGGKAFRSYSKDLQSYIDSNTTSGTILTSMTAMALSGEFVYGIGQTSSSPVTYSVIKHSANDLKVLARYDIKSAMSSLQSYADEDNVYYFSTETYLNKLEVLYDFLYRRDK